MIVSSTFIEPGGKDCYGHYCQPSYQYKMQCDYCGTEFETFNYRKKYCCENCTNQAGIKNRKERKAQARKRKCQVCGEMFIPPRNDAKFCSDKCKQAAYRNRKRNCKESKPFLLECFRLPENERKESPLGYYSSSLYKNGIGFDKLIEEWEGIPAIKDKVNIVKYTNYERLDRQEFYFKDNYYSNFKNDPMTRYPFLILSNDSILSLMPMIPDDKQLTYYQTQIILDKIATYIKE
jgi:predicted nucleic acid-binding Zn ribbon protein